MVVQKNLEFNQQNIKNCFDQYKNNKKDFIKEIMRENKTTNNNNYQKINKPNNKFYKVKCKVSSVRSGFKILLLSDYYFD